MEYHLPVLAKQSIEEMSIKSDGIYVDATFGGGGHSRLILEQLGPEGRLFCFDQDPDARENLWEDERLTFFPANFRYIERFLKMEGVRKVDGILADLGVSSHQFDTAERGFSFRFDAKLDMRMSQSGEVTAAKFLRRPEISWQDICERLPELQQVPVDIAWQVECDVKYAGYIARQEVEVARQKRLAEKRIPDNLDYDSIGQLRTEAREKLAKIRPTSLAQASRISGITPADVALLMTHLDQ